MTRYTLIAIFLLGTMLGLACAGGDSPTEPTTPGVDAQTGNSENHVAWGVFDVAFDLENGTAEIVWNRAAEMHFDVTGFVTPPNCYDCVLIVNVHYDVNTQLFYIDFYVTNKTQATGYDVRCVITDPGGNKFLTNSDGITQVWGAPMQFKAINIDPERTFGSYEGHGNTLVFHFPPGENFFSMTYLIDASWPENVEEPLIEETYSDPVVNNGFSTTYVKTRIWDHQGDLNPDTIKIDLMVLGMSPNTPMYDDGLHNDNGPGDGVYGTDPFSTTVDLGVYLLNITAMDTAANLAWGQAAVRVQQTTGGPNDDPVITDVITDRTTANGGANEKIKITVDAYDPNGDPLGYIFEASSGSFTGQNENYIWWKPSTSNTGPQTITIHVVDDQGGEAVQQGMLWSTNKSVVTGSTQGMIPSATLTSLEPSATLHMDTDFIHKVLYINIWATGCPHCVSEMPKLTGMYNKYKSNPGYVQIYSNVGNTDNEIMNFINSHNYECTYWTKDPGSSYFGKLNDFCGNSNGIPQHYIFDRDGRCRYASIGGVSSTSGMEAVIDQLL